VWRAWPARALGPVRGASGTRPIVEATRGCRINRSRLLATHDQPIRLERPMAIHLAYAHPDRHRPPQSPILPSGLCYLMTANFRCVGVARRPHPLEPELDRLAAGAAGKRKYASVGTRTVRFSENSNGASGIPVGSQRSFSTVVGRVVIG
jgi:hypothetical protein